jgi:hypothetical protein
MSPEMEPMASKMVLRLFVFTLVNTKDGTIYVANSSNNVIRAISRSGNVTTFSGSGIAGSLAGVGTNARFSFPTDFSLGQDGARIT